VGGNGIIPVEKLHYYVRSWGYIFNLPDLIQIFVNSLVFVCDFYCSATDSINSGMDGDSVQRIG